MKVAGSSVKIHHTIKVPFQKAKSSVCTAQHTHKNVSEPLISYWTPADRRCGQPTQLFSGHRRLLAGFDSDRNALTHTQHGYRHIYITRGLNTTLLPEHASEERKASNKAMFGILGTMDRKVLLRCF
jgi:hypothetical protein